MNLSLAYILFGLFFNGFAFENISHHVKFIKKYTCGEPQARTFSWDELVSAEQLSFVQKLIPDYSVLHRCDSFSGGCRGNNICSPRVIEEVILPFKAVRWNGNIFELKIQQTNHTECSCQKKKFSRKNLFRC